jgi:hypothetical protein
VEIYAGAVKAINLNHKHSSSPNGLDFDQDLHGAIPVDCLYIIKNFHITSAMTPAVQRMPFRQRGFARRSFAVAATVEPARSGNRGSLRALPMLADTRVPQAV